MSQPSQFGPFPPAAPKPFQAAPLGAATPSPEPFRFEYLRAYNYIFENPNWMMNIVWGFLSLASTIVIPVLGQLVFIGYQYEVAEALCVSRGSRYPDFDLNRFAEYLGRSIWPFLVGLISMVVMLPVIVVMYVLMIAAVGVGVSVGGDDFGGVLGVLGFLVVLVIGIAAWLAMLMVLTPMTLRAGLQQDFAAAFDFAWIKDFIQKTWMEMILSSLFIMFSGFVIVLLGYIALCIGAFASMAIILLAQAHIMYQLYTLYLSRGGMAFPFKPRMPPAAATYMPPPGFAPPPQI